MRALSRALLGLLALLLAHSLSAPIVFAQSAKGRVRGYIFDASGRPIRGARVVIRGATVGQSDEEGAFLLELEPGRPELLIDAPGVPRVRIAGVPIVAEQLTEVLIVLREGAADVDIEAPEATLTSTRTATATAAFGQVRGVVRGEEKGEPVASARVFVRGSASEARTDARGRFALVLPEGPVELTVIHPDYSTKTVPDIVVSDRGVTEIEIRLAPQTVEVAEVVVTAPRIEGGTVFVLQERRDASSVSDVLGAEQISKSGDSDAAAALQRVTGVTIVDGKYVYVRGLGERYSSTLLNGSSLPSPDPERRVVPLDIFPASILGAIVLEKTYSPWLPGEFGGGTVILRTKEIPEELTAQIGLDLGYLSATTFSDGLRYVGNGAADFFGFGAGPRQLPPEVKEASDQSRLRRGGGIGQEGGFTPAELEGFGKQLNNNFGLSRSTIPADFGVNGSVGGKFSLFGAKAGAVGGFTYSNEWFHRKEEFNNWFVSSGDQLQKGNDFDIEETNNTVTLSGIGSLGLEISDDQKLKLLISINRMSDNAARLITGITQDERRPTERTRLRYIERMLVANQLSGEHMLAPKIELKLDWRYMLSFATRDEPDRRETTYDQDSTSPDLLLSLRPDGNLRFYSELFDINHDIGTDLSLPFSISNEAKSEAKAGFAAMLKNRTVDVRRFYYRDVGSIDRDTLLLPPDQVFNENTISPAGFELTEFTLPTDNYTADQQLFAGYLSGDFAFSKRWKLMAGARLESSSQNLETFEPNVANPDVISANLNTLDVLPAGTLSWEFVDDMILRVAGSRTVARPNFRELSPAQFIDQTGVVYRGNTELGRTTITNADLRWEWYPNPGESVSVAGFFKAFENPIEYTIAGGAREVVEPRNVDTTAYNFGGELEARKELGFITDVLSDLSVAGNLTLVSSSIDLSNLGDEVGVLTTLERPLQGQSPYAVNGQLSYDNPDIGTQVSVLYNVFGPRIVQVGILNAPDVYEEPVHRLDFVFRQRIGERTRLSFKAKNLINPAIVQTQGEEVRSSYRRGRAFNLGLTIDLD